MRTKFLLALAALAVAALVAVIFLSGTPDPATATGGNSISALEPGQDAGDYSSLALDANGYPVISYRAISGDQGVKVLHCNDPNCQGGDESINVVGSGGHTSLALDASGYPVVSYYDESNWPNTALKVLHCNDPNCAGGDESSTSPDTAGDVGRYASLALDASGYPVVSYYDNANGDLKVLHCNDPNCSGGDDSITSPDTSGDVGEYTSLALDGSGNPVVSYYDRTNGDLKVLHCNDPNCSGGDDSITSPDTGVGVGSSGAHTTLALDASGYPVVSYRDGTNGDLKVLHCGNANCTSGNSITSPDSAGDVGQWTSLALDAGGYPVVIYSDEKNQRPKVMHCNDPNCAGGDESITSPDSGASAAAFPSLVLDASGSPVASYVGWGPADYFRLLHCGDPNCAGKPPTATPTPTSTSTPTVTPTKQPHPDDTDGDGCSDQQENGGNERQGGQRDYLNPWDYFDTDGDSYIDLPNDILGVILRYTAGGGEYDAAYDRGPSAGPNAWNMTAPDGTIDLPNDILGVILQYQHDCR